jgi:hypothetical protein
VRDERLLLKLTALLYALGLALHTADHFRRGIDTVTHHVFWAGNLSTAMGVAAVVLILAGHRLAPMAAVAFGFPIAIGVAAVHLLPRWSVFSDSFVDNRLSWMSWTVVTIEIVGALATGVVGWRITRSELSTASTRRAPASAR